MIGRAARAALDCEPVEARGVAAVDRGPQVLPVADIGRDALVARHRGQHRHEPVPLALPVDRTGIADDRCVDALVGQRGRRLLRRAREAGVDRRPLRFADDLSRRGHQHAAGDQERTVRTGEHLAEDLDRPAFLRRKLDDIRQIEPERGVDDAVGRARAGAKDVEIAQRADQRRHPGGGQRLRLLLAADEAGHSVSGSEEFARSPSRSSRSLRSETYSSRSPSPRRRAVLWSVSH